LSKEQARKLKLPARLSELENLVDFVLAAARREGLGEEETAAVHLAVDEACTNIINYSYSAGETGTIEVEHSPDPGSFTVIIRDHGRPFDPTLSPAPGLEADISRRPVGGLGIFLMKKSLDELRYRRRGGRNELTLVKNLTGTKKQ